MRMHRVFATAAAVSMLALSACSTGGGPDVGDAVKDDKADKGLETVGEAVTWDPNQLVNDGEPIALDWWLWGFDTQSQAIADAYQEIHPNVDIQVVVQPWDDYWTKLPLDLQAGSGPAIFNVHNSQHDNLIANMAPYDIELDDLRADYANVDAHVIDDEVYYIDFGLMTGSIFYNTDMWAAAGLTDADIPVTWDEFRDVAKKLTITEGDQIVQAGFNFNGQFNAFQSGLAYQLGQNMFAADQTTPDIDNAANLEVIQRFVDIYADGSGSKDFGAATDSFGQGQSAMVYSWGHFGGTLAADFPDTSWSAFQTPVPDAAETPYAFDRTNGESTIGINKNASPQEQAVAQDFLRYYLTNTELMKEMCLTLGVLPTYGPLSQDPEILEAPVLKAFGDVDGYIWPGPFPAAFETNITTMWEDILYNGVAPEVALTNAQAAISTDVESSTFVSLESLYTGDQAQD